MSRRTSRHDHGQKDEVTGLEVALGIAATLLIVLPAIAWWIDRLGLAHPRP